jgi:hypothetical protein
MKNDKEKPFSKFIFPVIKNMSALTDIWSDLMNVQPMSDEPIGKVFYVKRPTLSEAMDTLSKPIVIKDDRFKRVPDTVQPFEEV